MDLIDAFRARTISSASLWVWLDRFMAKSVLSRAERREEFWRAHSRQGQLILERQEPRFDPGHNAWKAEDDMSLRLADYALARAMHISYLSEEISVIRHARQEAAIALTSIFLGLVIAGALILVSFPDACLFPWALFGIAALVGAVVLWMYTRPRLRSLRDLRDGAKRVPDWARDGLNEDLELESRFVDPNLLLESTEAKSPFETLKDFELWQRIDRLLERGLVLDSERRQLFWDFLSKEDRDALTTRCSLYSPQHLFWTSKDKSATDKAENLLVELSHALRERAELKHNWPTSVLFAINGSLFAARAWKSCTLVSIALVIFSVGLFLVMSAKCIGNWLKSRRITRELELLTTTSA